MAHASAFLACEGQPHLEEGPILIRCALFFLRATDAPSFGQLLAQMQTLAASVSALQAESTASMLETAAFKAETAAKFSALREQTDRLAREQRILARVFGVRISNDLPGEQEKVD